MTLKELISMTAETKESLDYKTLFEGKSSTYRIIAERKLEGAELTVLENGYVLYRCDSRVTAFPLRECKGYSYHTVDGEVLSVSFEQLLEMEWSVPLMLAGERRITRNRITYEKRMESQESVLGQNAEEDEKLIQKLLTEKTGGSAEETVLERDSFEYLISGLTDTQKQIARRLYEDCCTWQEIVEEFGGNYSSVRQINERIMERIRRKIMKEKIF